MKWQRRQLKTAQRNRPATIAGSGNRRRRGARSPAFPSSPRCFYARHSCNARQHCFRTVVDVSAGPVRHRTTPLRPTTGGREGWRRSRGAIRSRFFARFHPVDWTDRRTPHVHGRLMMDLRRSSSSAAASAALPRAEPSVHSRELGSGGTRVPVQQRPEPQLSSGDAEPVTHGTGPRFRFYTSSVRASLERAFCRALSPILAFPPVHVSFSSQLNASLHRVPQNNTKKEREKKTTPTETKKDGRKQNVDGKGKRKKKKKPRRVAALSTD